MGQAEPGCQPRSRADCFLTLFAFCRGVQYHGVERQHVSGQGLAVGLVGILTGSNVWVAVSQVASAARNDDILLCSLAGGLSSRQLCLGLIIPGSLFGAEEDYHAAQLSSVPLACLTAHVAREARGVELSSSRIPPRPHCTGFLAQASHACAASHAVAWAPQLFMQYKA